MWESWLVKLGVSQGVCRSSVTSPMMGSTPYGLVGRRTCPLGRATHAPADPRALSRVIRRSFLHLSRAAPGSPKVGSRMVPGEGGAVGRRRLPGAHLRLWTSL